MELEPTIQVHRGCFRCAQPTFTIKLLSHTAEQTQESLFSASCFKCTSSSVWCEGLTPTQDLYTRNLWTLQAHPLRTSGYSGATLSQLANLLQFVCADGRILTYNLEVLSTLSFELHLHLRLLLHYQLLTGSSYPSLILTCRTTGLPKCPARNRLLFLP